LAALASGELPEAEATSIRAHVAVCGACDAMLVRLRRFEEAKAGELPVEGPDGCRFRVRREKLPGRQNNGFSLDPKKSKRMHCLKSADQWP
jgi:hypothetical protein